MIAVPVGVRRWVRPLLFAVAAVATLVALAVWVFPTRTWLDQREATADAEDELGGLQARRAELEARLELLDRDDEIERIARSQYGLVFPGEEAYAVLPAPAPAPEQPAPAQASESGVDPATAP